MNMELDIHEQYFQISDKSEISLQFEGKSDTNLLVVLPKDCPHMELVVKILKAINIQDLNDTKQLYLSSHDGISLYPLIKDTEVNRIISFGIPTTQLGLHVDHRLYQTVDFRNLQIIISADLDIVSVNPEHKKALWGALKQWT